MNPRSISSALGVFDLQKENVDLMTIQNRRFMYHPDGILILGAEDTTRKTRGVLKSHAEEYGIATEKFALFLPPYDEFVRGWIGVGKHYPDGIIHFAPHVPSMCGPYFEAAFDFIEQAARNGFGGQCMLRGFGEVWERPLSDVLGESTPAPKKKSLDAQREKRDRKVPLNEKIQSAAAKAHGNEGRESPEKAKESHEPGAI